MDKETAFSMGLAAASFLPGPVGLVARGASFAMLANEGWKHREAIADVTSRAIGITPAAAQAPPREIPGPPVWNGIEVRGPHDAPRARKGKFNTESAATPAAPVTAPQAVMPTSAAQPTPSSPVATVDANRTSDALEQRREIIRARIRSLTEQERQEANRGHYGPKAGGIGEKLEKANEELRQVDKDEAAAKKADESRIAGWATMAAAGAGMAAGIVGYRIAGAVGAGTARGAIQSIANIAMLGKAAGALNKSKTLLTGTPKGDALKGIVAAAKPAQAALARAGEHVARSTQLMGKVSSGLYVTGGLEGAGSYYFEKDSPTFAAGLRAASGISIGLASGLKLGSMGVAASSMPQVGASAARHLKAASARLEREAAGGAMRASKHRIGVEVASAKKDLIGASAAVKIGDVKAGQAVARVRGAPAKRRATVAAAAQTPAKRPILSKAAQKVEAKARADAAARAVATKVAKRKQAIQGAYQLGINQGAAKVVGSRALARHGGPGWSKWAQYQSARARGVKWKGPIPERPTPKALKRIAPPRLAVAA